MIDLLQLIALYFSCGRMADRTSVLFDIEFKRNDKRTRILRDIDSFYISTVETKSSKKVIQL